VEECASMEQRKVLDPEAAEEGEQMFRVCYRLLSGAIIDRLKRREANSLITNFMLLLAFHFGITDVALRMAVTFVLNVLVYFINDFIDVEIDLANEKKDHAKALYIKAHKRTAFALIVCLTAALLILTLLYSQSVCLGVILALLIIFLYTDYFKNMAYFDIIGCFVWGLSMAWPAIPDFSPKGIRLILLIGIFTASFEVVQCIKDYDSDKKYNLRTTPIVIGIPKAFLLARSLYVLATIYTVFILGEIQGLLLLVPILFRTDQKMDAYWMKLRVVYGIVWVTIMVRLYFGWYAG
jgi:4-hydroxybenzoate polyprenyltransferase